MASWWDKLWNRNTSSGGWAAETEKKNAARAAEVRRQDAALQRIANLRAADAAQARTRPGITAAQQAPRRRGGMSDNPRVGISSEPSSNPATNIVNMLESQGVPVTSPGNSRPGIPEGFFEALFAPRSKTPRTDAPSSNPATDIVNMLESRGVPVESPGNRRPNMPKSFFDLLKPSGNKAPRSDAPSSNPATDIVNMLESQGVPVTSPVNSQSPRSRAPGTGTPSGGPATDIVNMLEREGSPSVRPTTSKAKPTPSASPSATPTATATPSATPGATGSTTAGATASNSRHPAVAALGRMPTDKDREEFLALKAARPGISSAQVWQSVADRQASAANWAKVNKKSPNMKMPDSYRTEGKAATKQMESFNKRADAHAEALKNRIGGSTRDEVLYNLMWNPELEQDRTGNALGNVLDHMSRNIYSAPVRAVTPDRYEEAVAQPFEAVGSFFGPSWGAWANVLDPNVESTWVDKALVGLDSTIVGGVGSAAAKQAAKQGTKQSAARILGDDVIETAATAAKKTPASAGKKAVDEVIEETTTAATRRPKILQGRTPSVSKQLDDDLFGTYNPGSFSTRPGNVSDEVLAQVPRDELKAAVQLAREDSGRVVNNLLNPAKSRTSAAVRTLGRDSTPAIRSVERVTRALLRDPDIAAKLSDLFSDADVSLDGPVTPHDPKGEEEEEEIEIPDFTFGPDGQLLISSGDGGWVPASRAQAEAIMDNWGGSSGGTYVRHAGG